MSEPHPRSRHVRRSRSRRRLSRLAVLVAGGLPILIFPKVDAGWLAWVVLIPALLLVRASPTAREAAVRGWLLGLGFNLAINSWLAPSTSVFFPVVCAILALLWLPWGVLCWALLRPPMTGRRAIAALLGVPAGWVLIETARSWDALGGPWALLGASQWQHPVMLGLASVGGVWLVSFAIVLANTAGVLLVTGAGAIRLVAAVTAAVSVVAAPLAYAAQAAPQGSGVARVALVQPGVINGDAKRLAAGEHLTAGLARQHLDLVVWGESSVSYDPSTDPAVLHRLTALSAEVGADLLVGVDAHIPSGGIAKFSYLIGPGGVLGRYEKTRLVPFGEYIPLRPVLGWIADVSKAASVNRQHGTGPTVMRAGSLVFGPLICFESAFPDMARTVVNMGAELIAYQTSDATFQDTWGPAQHASLGALRAAETGRPVVQAALTGESVAFDAVGRRLASLGTTSSGSLVVRVPLAARTTLYDRWGNYVPVVCLVLTGVAVLTCRWDWADG